MFIERINEMLEIRKLQNDYRDLYGKEPYNISSWLTSKEFERSMSKVVKLPEINHPIDYVYTYSIDTKILDDLIYKISKKNLDNVKVSLASNTTQTIVSIVNLLSQFKFKKVGILDPAYFSVAHVHKILNLEYEIVSVSREQGKYIIPFDLIEEKSFDALWITSPIFSTGVYFSDEDIEKFEKIMNKGTLIISDESFCTEGNEIIGRIKDTNNFIGLYSPHKALDINAIKFSAILMPERYDEFIEHWVDILTGNLPGSSSVAIEHYLSKNYDLCVSEYRKFINSAYKEIMDVVSEYENIVVDEINDGSLFTLYFHELTYDQIKSKEFIRDTIFETGTSFYPSYLNGFNESFGFAFRINVALYNKEFKANLKKLIDYLMTKK